MRALAIVACVVAAIAALLLSYLAAWDLYLTGFPDGHLTDYDKAVDAPKPILRRPNVSGTITRKSFSGKIFGLYSIGLAGFFGYLIAYVILNGR